MYAAVHTYTQVETRLQAAVTIVIGGASAEVMPALCICPVQLWQHVLMSSLLRAAATSPTRSTM
jgi:hypothetical protein